MGEIIDGTWYPKAILKYIVGHTGSINRTFDDLNTLPGSLLMVLEQKIHIRSFSLPLSNTKIPPGQISRRALVLIPVYYPLVSLNPNSMEITGLGLLLDIYPT
jgi:hypothetical protein